MILVITRDGCSNCDYAKGLLKAESLDFLEYKIGVNITREEVLENYPGRKTLPIIVDKHAEMTAPRLKTIHHYKYEEQNVLENDNGR